ncbi:MAG: hypothetical protein AAFO82_05430 [Bacteroidota bacterium]
MELIKKSDKIGLKILVRWKGGLNLIDSKYDRIEMVKGFVIEQESVLRIGPMFKVFEVEIDGKIGYVGENGVEYFNFE